MKLNELLNGTGIDLGFIKEDTENDINRYF